MICLIILLFGTLPDYSVTVDPVLLACMLEHPDQGLEIPAELCCSDTLTVQGTLALRGGTSLWLDKKSYHITLEEDAFTFGGHVLLNAQFRDPSLMRNTLGLLLTRKLGFPAPETEFVTLHINGTYEGVYERVERVDRFFYQRNGTGFGPLFKSVDTMGRLVSHYSDTSGTTGFEPKIDSEPYSWMLLELIEACLRNDVSSLNAQEFMALFAVNAAIFDRDGVIKNVYLHHYGDQWHVYPWDRDATFGNDWTGAYIPGWTEKAGLADACYSGSARGLLESSENIALLNQYISQASGIMLEEYPGIVDSIRVLIREPLSRDPYYQYSMVQFDSICAVLAGDIEARAAWLPNVFFDSRASSIEELQISHSLDLDDEVEVELELEGGDPFDVAILVSIDGRNEEWHYMQHEGDGEYSITLDVPPGAYCARFAVGPRIMPCYVPVFYPSWSFRGYAARPVPAPGARRALADLVPSHFSPGEPVWCGENLWILPVTNQWTSPQDLSLCSFIVGDPPATVFFPESILIGPGETFHLTNDASIAEGFCSGRVFGDGGTPFPGTTQLTLRDPAWHDIHSWDLALGDSLPVPGDLLIPSELCVADGSDWVEIFNGGEVSVSLSGWYLTDSKNNVSMIPSGVSVAPGGFAVLSEEPLPGVETDSLHFGLNASADTLSLYTAAGSRVFTMGWNESWPVGGTGIIFLLNPVFSFSSPISWEAAEPPGTPGAPNPGWEVQAFYTRVRLTSQNPCEGAFSFHYETSSQALEAVLYDMTGRRIAGIPLPPAREGTVDADFSGSLPSGVYILYLRSEDCSDSVRFTVLRKDQQ